MASDDGSPVVKHTTATRLARAAFVLLAVATALILARTGLASWAALPPLLLLATHATYVVKYSVHSKDTYAWLNDLARVLRAAYFCLVIIWPFPLHWYDGLAILALLLTSNDVTAGNTLLALYYSISAAAHAGHGEVLQAVGRTVLGALGGLALHAQTA